MPVCEACVCSWKAGHRHRIHVKCMRLLIDIDEKNKQGNDGSDGDEDLQNYALDDLRGGGDREGGAKRHKPMSAAKC